MIYLRLRNALLAMAVLFAMLYVPAYADTSFAVGIGASNAACGTGEPNVAVRAERDDDRFPMHFNGNVGPNGSCTGQGVAIDAYAGARRYLGQVGSGWFIVGAIGYDTRTLPFEYVRTDVAADAFKHFHGVRAETVQLMGGAGWDCGDNCSVRLLYQGVDTPLAAGGSVAPVQIAATYQWGDAEFNLTVDEAVTTLDIEWEFREGIKLSGHVVDGMPDLDNGAPLTLAGGYLQASTPPRLYGFEITLDL